MSSDYSEDTLEDALRDLAGLYETVLQGPNPALRELLDLNYRTVRRLVEGVHNPREPRDEMADPALNRQGRGLGRGAPIRAVRQDLPADPQNAQAAELAQPAAPLYPPHMHDPYYYMGGPPMVQQNPFQGPIVQPGAPYQLNRPEEWVRPGIAVRAIRADVGLNDPFPQANIAAGTRRYGTLDNLQQYELHIRANPVFKNMLTLNFNRDPLTRDNSTSPAAVGVLYIYCIGRCLFLEKHSGLNVNMLFWGEALGPYIHADKFTPQNAVDAQFVAAIEAFCQPPTLDLMTDIDADLPGLWTTATRAGNGVAGAAEYVARGYLHQQASVLWPNGIPPHLFGAGPLGLNIEQALLIAAFFGSYIDSARKFSSMVMGVYVSVAKLGNATSEVLDKISRGVSLDSGEARMRLSAQEVQMFWKIYGEYIDENNVAPLLDHWLRLLPNDQLRLRLTLQQVLNVGLSSFVVIRDALTTFPHFPWSQIARIYQAECQRYLDAVEESGNNPWWGYRKQQGAVQSKNYRNLSWVAKELLIRSGTQPTLARYNGWIPVPLNQTLVNQLIDGYLAGAGMAEEPLEGHHVLSLQMLSTVLPPNHPAVVGGHDPAAEAN